MEYPIRIKASDGDLVHAVCSGPNAIEVREGDGLRWMHFEGDAIQAMMVIDDPSRPIIPYQIYMLGALLFYPTPEFVLNLGVGGGSFERFFSTYLPEVAVASVESNPDVIKLLRKEFPVPQRMPVINQDGETFLSDCVTTYDVILCDLFDHSSHSSCISKREFYADAFRCLSTDGLFVINLMPDTETEMVDILVAVRASFTWVLMLQVPHFHNILLFCFKQAAAERELLELRARDLFETTGIDLTDVTGLITTLPKREV